MGLRFKTILNMGEPGRQFLLMFVDHALNIGLCPTRRQAAKLAKQTLQDHIDNHGNIPSIAAACSLVRSYCDAEFEKIQADGWQAGIDAFEARFGVKSELRNLTPEQRAKLLSQSEF